jgi:hypothetical protein
VYGAKQCHFDADIDIARFGRLISGKGAKQTKFCYAVLFGKTLLVVAQNRQDVVTSQHDNLSFVPDIVIHPGRAFNGVGKPNDHSTPCAISLPFVVKSAW